MYAYNERLTRHICQDTRAWLKLSELKSSAGCQLRFAREIRTEYAIDTYMESDTENSTREEVITMFQEAALEWQMTQKIDAIFEIPSEAQLKKKFQWDKNLLEGTKTVFTDWLIREFFRVMKIYKLFLVYNSDMCYEQYNCEFNKTADCATNESLAFMINDADAANIVEDVELGNDQLKEAEETGIVLN